MDERRAFWTAVYLAGGLFGGIVVPAMLAQEPATGDGPMASWIEAEQTCADCHEDRVAAFAANPHAAAGATAATVGCSACHGDPTRHVDEGGGEGTIFAFSDSERPGVKSQVCQSCHAGEHPRFEATAHARSGLACTDCHRVHAPEGGGPPALGLLRSTDGGEVAHSAAGIGAPMGRVTRTCGGCHGDVVAQFQLNERHRLQEGILDCTSCHDPHRPATRLALGGFGEAGCSDCHADKDGPFVFEHGSQRVEGCTACHSPHGSPNRHLLTFQRVAELCYSCHAAVPGFHTRFTLETNCTNCHSSIHGSNFDPAFLK